MGHDLNPDLSTVCRLCLSIDATVDIFAASKSDASIPKRMMTCLALEAHSSDGLPTNMCPECRYQLEKSYYFRKRSQASVNKLRKHIRLLELGKTSRVFATKTAEEVFEEELDYEESLNFLRDADEQREKQQKEKLEECLEKMREGLREETETYKETVKEELRHALELELRLTLRPEIVDEVKREMSTKLRQEEVARLLNDMETFLREKRTANCQSDDLRPAAPKSQAQTSSDETSEKVVSLRRRVKRKSLTPTRNTQAAKLVKLDAASTADKPAADGASKFQNFSVYVDNSEPFTIIPMEMAENHNDESAQFVLQQDAEKEATKLVEEEAPHSDTVDGDDDFDVDFYASEFDSLNVAPAKNKPQNKETSLYQIDISDVPFYKNATKPGKEEKTNSAAARDNEVLVLDFSECVSENGGDYESMDQSLQKDDLEQQSEDTEDTPVPGSPHKRLSRDDLTEETEEKNAPVFQENNQRQTDTAKSFKCELCPSVFSTASLIARHMRSHDRMEERGIAYQCPQCQLVLSCRSALTRHMLVHSGERPHQCPYCEKSFVQREVLKRHLCLHTGEKPHKCEHCSRKFTQKANLVTHMRTAHTDSEKEARHSCPLCTKSFNHASGLSRHLVTHSGVQFQCSKCERTFCDRSSVKRHIANVHSNMDVPVLKVEERVPE